MILHTKFLMHISNIVNSAQGICGDLNSKPNVDQLLFIDALYMCYKATKIKVEATGSHICFSSS